jgi:hypothetical protein
LRWMLPALACCLLLAGCSRRPDASEERALTLAQARTFSDGGSADRWQDTWGSDHYRLPDGTELLWVQKPMGPEDVVNGQETVQDLNETALTLPLDEPRMV